jgi:hypothetical protein
MYVCIYICI